MTSIQFGKRAMIVVVRRRPCPAAPNRNEGMIDNLVILATCSGILAVAIRAILMERREAARPLRIRR
jgi:hypothetical protein